MPCAIGLRESRWRSRRRRNLHAHIVLVPAIRSSQVYAWLEHTNAWTLGVGLSSTESLNAYLRIIWRKSRSEW
jgi:hypothetical protein